MVDTGGMVGTGDFFSPLIHQQALVAIDEADVIIFMFDGTKPLSMQDKNVAKILRREVKKAEEAGRTKLVILVANKLDSETHRWLLEKKAKSAIRKVKRKQG